MIRSLRFGLRFIFGIMTCNLVYAQDANFTAARGEIDFTYILRDWDGFGFNYVETSQTYDYQRNPQDYGGFKFLDDKDKRKIIDLVFGDDGLRPAIVKMFLDPLHQKSAGGPYDHETTTRNMRHFVKEGLKVTRARGDELSVITTLYAPPAYMTKQKVMRGRDLDPDFKEDLAMYMIDWAKFIKEKEGIPLRYISLHNEGESWLRWPEDGTTGGALDEGHDYNFFWTPEQTVDMLVTMSGLLKKSGLRDVALTNGEYTNWYRFYHWGFARALVENRDALDNLGLITSHGFYVGTIPSGRWYGPHSNLGTDLVRAVKPSLHAWVTSTAWNIFEPGVERRAVMDAHFVKEIYGNIYEAKVNGIIPWAGIQTHSQWWKPDPNPGSAIRVYDDGTFEIPKAYYFYKQVSRAGQPGMAVAYTEVMDSEFSIIAFARNKSKHPNAFVVTNTGKSERKIVIHLKGISARKFRMFITDGREEYTKRETARVKDDGSSNYKENGTIKVINNTITYQAPAGSVTTFFQQD